MDGPQQLLSVSMCCVQEQLDFQRAEGAPIMWTVVSSALERNNALSVLAGLKMPSASANHAKTIITSSPLFSWNH